MEAWSKREREALARLILASYRVRLMRSTIFLTGLFVVAFSGSGCAGCRSFVGRTQSTCRAPR